MTKKLNHFQLRLNCWQQWISCFHTRYSTCAYVCTRELIERPWLDFVSRIRVSNTNCAKYLIICQKINNLQSKVNCCKELAHFFVTQLKKALRVSRAWLHVCTAQTQKPTVKHTHLVYLKVGQAKTSSQPTPTPKMDWEDVYVIQRIGLCL